MQMHATSLGTHYSGWRLSVSDAAAPATSQEGFRGKVMYDIVVLARLGTWNSDEAGEWVPIQRVEGINDLGVGCGSIEIADGTIAPAIWSPDGVSRQLACGPHGGAAVAINNHGIAVGYEFTTSIGRNRRAVAWVNGDQVRLPLLDGVEPSTPSCAGTINEQSMIGGRIGETFVIWTGVDTGCLRVPEVPARFSSFFGPNDNGAIAGRIGLPEAFQRQSLGIWKAGEIAIRNFPDIDETFRYFVTGFNGRDQVLVTGADRNYDDLGWFGVVSHHRDVVVDRRHAGLKLFAHDLNDAGVVVGQAELHGTQAFPFIWTAGEPVNLNRLISEEAGLTLFAATAINNNGAILANADDADGNEYQVLLRPRKPGN